MHASGHKTDAGRIPLGDNTDTGVVMLQQIGFPFHGAWISTGLPCTYLYTSPHVCSIMTWAKLDLHWNFWNITTMQAGE